MVKFVKKEVAAYTSLQKEQLGKVIAVVSAEARLKGQSAVDLRDSAMIAEGRTLLKENMKCTDCHQFLCQGRGRERPRPDRLRVARLAPPVSEQPRPSGFLWGPKRPDAGVWRKANPQSRGRRIDRRLAAGRLVRGAGKGCGLNRRGKIQFEIPPSCSTVGPCLELNLFPRFRRIRAG